MKMCVFLFLWFFFIITNFQIWVCRRTKVLVLLESLSEVGPKHFTHMFSDFFWNSFAFGKATYSHFRRVTIPTEHLLFWSSSFFQSSCLLFFEKLGFWKSHFLAAVAFSEYLIFRSDVSTEQLLLENRKFFMAVTFWNTYFFSGGIV